MYDILLRGREGLKSIRMARIAACAVVGFAALLAAPASWAAPTAEETDRMLLNEDDGKNWASYGRTRSEAHYSPLTEINDKNVGNLKLQWFYDIDPVVSTMAAPLAVDGVLFFATGYSVMHAMDAKTGKLLWKYDPEVYKLAGDDQMRAAWGIRGFAYHAGKIYTGTHDGRLISIDAKTGKMLWSVATTQPKDGRYITGAPWVYKDTVVIGHGGADYRPVRGYVTAYDANTGKQKWRFFTVPGNPADGFENKAMEMAAKTWTGEWWKFGGGGTVWNAMAYDPKLNLIYLGTGNGMPWNQKVRSPGGGDNLFVCSVVALNADTGEYVWHYQMNPGETWDYNAAMDIQLADLMIDGKKREVLMQAPKNGFFYVIDRANGKLISAEPIVKVTWAEKIDLKTGRPIENPESRYPDGKVFELFPNANGGHNVQPMAFNPKTGLVYIPTLHGSTFFTDLPGDPKDFVVNNNWVINSGHGRAVVDPSKRKPSTSGLLAWNPVTQKPVWDLRFPGGVNGGAATTAGNLVFHGTAAGKFAAYAADTGKELWSTEVQSGIVSQPITYQVDGKQLVTIVTGYRGYGGSSGRATEWDYYTQKRRVLTFSLDGKATLPPFDETPRPFVDDNKFQIDEKKAANGAQTFSRHCTFCHGFGAVSGGAGPDLRKSEVPLEFETINAVVHEGALKSQGMPQYNEFTRAQIEELQHYIRDRAREAIRARPAN